MLLSCTYSADIVAMPSYNSGSSLYLSFRFFLNGGRHTEANSTSLTPLDTILPEMCAFIIGFSFIMWTKMKPLLAY